MKAKYLNW